MFSLFRKSKNRSASSSDTNPSCPQRPFDQNTAMGIKHSSVWRGETTPEDVSLRMYHKARRSGMHSQIERAQDHTLWSPPPYTDVITSPSCKTSSYTSADDSPYAYLKEFDTIFVVDDSSSMLGPRWKEAEEAIAAIAPICTTYDRDGIDIYFLNHRRASMSDAAGAYRNVTTATRVREIFKSVQPRGVTPFGKRLAEILMPYVRRVERMTAATNADGVLTDPSLFVKPLNIIAITDGRFTDDAESIIIQTAKDLDGPACRAVPWQVGIQFFQIGTDQAAAQYLQELDDDLVKTAKGQGLRDIVDTVPWKGNSGQTLNADGIMKCVLGAVHKKYDRRDAFR